MRGPTSAGGLGVNGFFAIQTRPKRLEALGTGAGQKKSGNGRSGSTGVSWTGEAAFVAA